MDFYTGKSHIITKKQRYDIIIQLNIMLTEIHNEKRAL